ncbi:MAG: hypothetical protein U9P72_06725 [Campylobacterota bacterium]|nr:hypothetical protein [Campylobacterota bacterium]
MKYLHKLLDLKKYFFKSIPIISIGIAEILVYFFNINLLIILVLIVLSSIISIYLLCKELSIYKSFFNNKIILVLISFITLMIMYVSSVLVNSYIVEFAHVNPSLFPLAQQILFPLVSIIPWSIVIYILFLSIFVFFIFKTFYDIHKDNKKVIQVKNEDTNNILVLYINIIIGSAIILIVVFPLWNKFLFSDYYRNEVLKKVFIFSSYYPNNENHICSDLNETYLIAFLNKDNISYIKNTDNNVIFLLDKCIQGSPKL